MASFLRAAYFFHDADLIAAVCVETEVAEDMGAWAERSHLIIFIGFFAKRTYMIFGAFEEVFGNFDDIFALVLSTFSEERVTYY